MHPERTEMNPLLTEFLFLKHRSFLPLLWLDTSVDSSGPTENDLLNCSCERRGRKSVVTPPGQVALETRSAPLHYTLG